MIPRFWDEKSALKTCFAALWRASQRWQPVRMTAWGRLHREHMRQDLDGTEGAHQRSKRDVA
ncbi:MAG: hypothetical protein K6U89_12970 [Chloroflexi bacterium]|nr:hypothetical protein [Chloroflexota bacterium]